MSYYPSYVWSEDSPAFDDEEVGVKIALAKGARSGRYRADEAWAIFGAHRFSREALAELGPAVSSAVRVVVQHRESGATWLRSAMEDEEPEDQLAAEEEGGSLLALSSCFAVDVKQLCDIPPRAGRYWVFAFAGRFVSEMIAFDVEA